MSEKEFDNLMIKRVKEFQKRIIIYKEAEEAKVEIPKLKENIKRLQENTLRNMISIFAIFVAIFSFLIIGVNTTLNIEPEAIPQVVVILFLVFTYSTLLLYFSIWYSKK